MTGDGVSTLEHDLETAYAGLGEQPAWAVELAAGARASGEARLVGRAPALEARVAIRRGDLEHALALVLEAEPLLAGCDAPDLVAEVAVASARFTFYSRC